MQNNICLYYIYKLCTNVYRKIELFNLLFQNSGGDVSLDFLFDSVGWCSVSKIYRLNAQP